MLSDPLLLQDMLHHIWHDVLSFNDIDDSMATLHFTTVLEGLLDFLVPLHKIRVTCKQNVSTWATNSDIYNYYTSL